MMTEEQLIDRICLTCVDVRHAATEESAQKFINDIRGLAEHLAALTQPASPALKLPDGWVAVPLEPSREMRLASKRYKSKTKLPTGPGVYKAMVAAAPAAPHTAPIEPICATGGAEWVKCSERMPGIDERTWRTPLPVLVLCELGVIPAYARTYTTLGGEKKVGFMASLTLGNACGKQPKSLYSSEVLTQVTMWREMPVAPEDT